MTLNTRQAPAIESTKQNQPGESQGGNQSSYFQWCKLNLLRSRNIPPVPQERQVSREYGANFASLITFQWVAPIVKLGYKRELEIQDIWTVNPTRSVSILSDRLDEALSARLARGGRQPLAWALYDTLKPGLWVGISCQVLSMCLLVLAPFVLRHIIEFAMGAYISQHNSLPGPNLGKGMGLVIGLVAMQLVQSLSSNQAFYQSLVAGGELKAVLTPKMFSKAMRLSGRARVGNKTGYSDGRITTLMAVDLSRLEKGCAVLHILCATPTALIIALITLLVNIGYSALAGYAFLVAMTCLLTFAVRSIIIRRRAINTITDKRVSLTQEILQNVRFIKFFAWENSFLGRLRTTRKLEIDLLRRFLATRHSITVSFTTMANFASLLSFMTYALSGHRLSTDRIFASLAVFNAIRLPLSMMNIVVTSTTDAVTSLNRLQEFLLAEERQDFITWDRNMEKAFEFEKASFEWESMPDVEVKTAGVDFFPVSASGPRTTSPWDGASKPVSETTDKGPFRLMDIDFQASRRELIAVIGAIGSGKSSVLGALAGEMRLTAGSVRMSTTPAFCPQYAWMQNTTIRNNILFGQQYDEARYNQVIDACALRPDLATFLDGDQTEIGEQGITLSGGQKQRLNIARAIYSDSDIILLDDPLSAVDADVGLHIMNQAICGLLKDRCRILVTHQLQFLAHCDRIVVMEAGRIVDIGTFEHLVQKNEVLQSLVSVHHHEKEETPGSPRLADAVQLREAAPKPKVTNRNAAPLMKEEERVRHARRRDIWRAYAVSSGSIANIFIVLALAVLSAGGTILSGVWLSFWVSNKFPQLSLGQYLGIYAGITGAQAAILYLFSVYVTTSAANASKAILEDAMYRVLRAPTSFFDTTPLGRIINRFSKDVQILDNELGETVRLFLYLFLIIVAIMVLVIVYFHYFALAVGPLVAIVIFVTIYHRASAQSLKRHEAVLRSVVFARFNEAITGVACIRAYSMEGYFRQSIGRAIDSMNAAYFLIFANQRWLSVRLDLVCNTLLLVTGALVVTSRFDVSPSISGLILSYMLSISQTLQFSIRQYTELEQHINSAERLHHYGTSLEEEKTDPLRLVEVSNTWPEQGQITFENVQMRYRDELPLVLRGLTVSFRSGERIGVVGRTGAGKSSIVSALFRLTELSGGNIRIDGVDISTIALHDLRSRLAIIPQDPTLFQGTIRSNLDPFNQYTDLELWSALRGAHLVGSPPEAPSDGDEDTCEVANEKAAGVSQLHLDTQVDEFGHNLSLGQRQLMALARAIVRDSRIVICDEATSSLDYQTDQKVQQTISSFHGKTLFCIAHRLRTIIHYDRICVMDKGCIAELDTPVRLWEQQGIFREMCNQSGITRGELERGPLGL